MDFPGGVASVFLISGGDNHLHLYKFVPESGFHELLGSKYLPTMTTSYPSSVISLDTEVFGSLGVLAVGCQDGTVQVISKQDGVTRQWSVSLDGPISSLKLFKSDVRGQVTSVTRLEPSPHSLIRSLQERIATAHYTEHSEAPHITPPLQSPLKTPSQSAAQVQHPFEVNLIVGASIGYAVIFKNILEIGFSSYHFLPESDKNDAVLAVGLADADFDHDGHTEILVGTYGRKLLVYKDVQKAAPEADAGRDGVNPSAAPATADQSAPSSDYKLVWQRQFVYPILDFLSDDWTGDGINDLVVCSKFGLHLMQVRVALQTQFITPC